MGIPLAVGPPMRDSNTCDPRCGYGIFRKLANLSKSKAPFLTAVPTIVGNSGSFLTAATKESFSPWDRVVHFAFHADSSAGVSRGPKRPLFFGALGIAMAAAAVSSSSLIPRVSSSLMICRSCLAVILMPKISYAVSIRLGEKRNRPGNKMGSRRLRV